MEHRQSSEGEGDDGPATAGEREVRRFLHLQQRGETDFDAFWRSLKSEGSDIDVLAALVKADLQRRFREGETPAAAEYLDRYPELREDTDRVTSVVYEEFCLLEENGKGVDPDSFCDRYPDWRDSVASQLRYHREFSKVLGPVPAPPDFPAAGAMFEQFLIVSELGRGGAARVYLAEDLSLRNRQVVLKISLDRGTEHEVLASLRHDHIVPVLSVGFAGESLLRGLCMEYRPGLALDEVIRRLDLGAARPATAAALWRALERPPTPPPLRTKVAPAGSQDATSGPMTVTPGVPGWSGFPAKGRYDQGVAWVGEKLAAALHHAHQQRIFHRDVKPANVLLTSDHGPQLLDFNLAYDPGSVSEAEAALNGGTLPYMAPEQLSAFLEPERWKSVGAAADIYSLGLLLRELITGTPPEAPEGGLPLRKAIESLLRDRPSLRADLRDRAPETSHALEAVINRALAHDPSDRYRTAEDFGEDLRRVAHGLPLKFARNPSRRERLGDGWRRYRPVAAALAVAAVIAVAASVFANRERLFVPVEQRPAFAKGVELGRTANAEEAVGLLAPLAEEAPTSPLVNFHLGVNLVRLKSFQLGSERLLAALSPPEGFEKVRARAAEEPELVGMAEQVGIAFLREVPQRPKPSEDWSAFLATADRAFALALAAEPNRPGALKGMSNLAERRKDFRRAVDLLNAVIAQFPAPTGPEVTGVGQLKSNRARATINWAQADLDDGPASTKDLDAIRARLVLAFRDIDFAKKAQGTEHPRLLVTDRFQRASGHFAFGSLFERDSNASKALASYIKAEEFLKQALPYSGGSKGAQELQARIQAGLDRLQNRVPGGAKVAAE